MRERVHGVRSEICEDLGNGKVSERIDPIQLDGFGFFGGCDYCIGELEEAIESANDGIEMTGGWPPFLRGKPRAIPPAWREAIAMAKSVADAEQAEPSSPEGRIICDRHHARL